MCEMWRPGPLVGPAPAKQSCSASFGSYLIMFSPPVCSGNRRPVRGVAPGAACRARAGGSAGHNTAGHQRRCRALRYRRRPSRAEPGQHRLSGHRRRPRHPGMESVGILEFSCRAFVNGPPGRRCVLRLASTDLLGIAADPDIRVWTCFRLA